MGGDEAGRESLFGIIDGIMFELGRTKKMFLIMILTVLILPPAMLLGTLGVLALTGFDLDSQMEQRLEANLERGEITRDEYERILESLRHRPPPLMALSGINPVIFVISLAWLTLGIRQWIVLSRWDKRYRRFRESMDGVDRRLAGDDPDGGAGHADRT